MTLVRYYTDKSGHTHVYEYSTVKGTDPRKRRREYDKRYRKGLHEAKSKPKGGKFLVDQLSQKQWKTIREMHQIGLSMRKIASLVGVSRHVIRRALERDGFLGPLKRSKG